MCGVYPDADVMTAGEEISSTYEGRHVTLLASELTHAGAVVTKGLPVVFGGAVGIALKTEVAGTDLIAIDTEGIWVIDVYAQDIDGGSAVVPGDRLFIKTDTCVVSKIAYQPGYIPFGYALGDVNAGNTDTIAVKVHQDASELTVIGGVTYFGAVNIGGMATLGGGATIAGTTDLQTVLVHSSLQVAVGGTLRFPQVTNATDLPAAAGALPSGSLWCNANVVTRVP